MAFVHFEDEDGFDGFEDEVNSISISNTHSHLYSSVEREPVVFKKTMTLQRLAVEIRTN